ncbi:MAG: Ribosome-binding ATPase YchF [Chloroflexi bacterium]|nr:Ribosome-binding ATPase YchF [Chloroflexota bacterium]
MELGIIGLPKSGKTTVFNALTIGKAEVAAYSTGREGPNVGVVKVPDSRLENLAAILKPERTIPAEVRYLDVGASPKGFGRREGIGGQFLAQLSKVDALIYVIRVFPDERIPHVEGSIEPERDAGILDLELAFSDLSIIERRLERLRVSLKAAKAAERELAIKEQSLLDRIKSALGDNVPLREQGLSEHECKAIQSFQFLTAKPLLLLFNIGEEQLDERQSLEERFRSRYRRPHSEVAVLCGKLEMELIQLSNNEAMAFRSSMELSQSGLDRAIRLSYGLLGLVSFFSIASDEVKAWTVSSGTTIQKAAGKIHSDMERGFIRAEVVGYDDLVKCGSIAEARHKGLIQLEGKNYVVQDGDVVTILFNI